MNVNELYIKLDEYIPRSLSCPWDNDGLMCCPDPCREVRRVLIALDVTAAVAEEAIEGGYDLIISHHPFIFKGLMGISPSNHIAAKAVRLIQAKISVFSFHTRLDATSGGVNDTLASLLGLENVSVFGENGETIGRVGDLPLPMSLEAFAARVKEALGAPAVAFADSGKPVSRVAILGGSGSDDVAAAMAAGADTYLSGELAYHHMTDAPDMGINLISAGHFYTEHPVCTVIEKIIKEFDPHIETKIMFSDRTKYI